MSMRAGAVQPIAVSQQRQSSADSVEKVGLPKFPDH